MRSFIGSRPSTIVDADTAPSACLLPWSMRGDIRYSVVQPNNAVCQSGASPDSALVPHTQWVRRFAQETLNLWILTV